MRIREANAGGRRRRAMLLLAALIGGWFVAPRVGPEEAEPLVPVHGDARLLVGATSDALRALLVEDAVAARLALDRVDAQIRELKAEEHVHYGRDLVSYSRALKQTINLARETAGRGDVDRAFDEFVSIQLACRTCHDHARKEGLVIMGKSAPVEESGP